MGLTRLITAFSLVAVLGLCFAPFSLAQSLPLPPAAQPVPNPMNIPTTSINGDVAISGNIWQDMGNSGFSVNGVTQSWNPNNPGSWFKQAGVMSMVAANVASVTTGNTLSSYTLSANSLAYTGSAVRVRIQGTTAANANAKTVIFNWGSTPVTLFSTTANAKDFYADIEIIKTGANTQQINVAGYANGALLNALSATSAQTDTANIIVSTQLSTAVANNDVVLTGFTLYGEP
jgi:hypothetical protein